jgi:hypothetical protein
VRPTEPSKAQKVHWIPIVLVKLASNDEVPKKLALKLKPRPSPAPLDRGDAHIGATEDQVSDTPAPRGDAYKDEPRQG